MRGKRTTSLCSINVTIFIRRSQHCCRTTISMGQLDSPPIVLFTYPESVVGRRTKWYLMLRGIPYHVHEVDNKMPRPVLDRLGVHYRRIPVMAVGRDIYCDSRCIIDHLERLYDKMPKLGFDQKDKPFEYGKSRSGLLIALNCWVCRSRPTC